jgi:hypothetical protein
MNAPSLPERVETLEHEVQGLESALDARTKALWQAVKELRAEVNRLQGRSSEEDK